MSEPVAEPQKDREIIAIHIEPMKRLLHQFDQISGEQRLVWKFEATTRPGMYADIPYIVVWAANDMNGKGAYAYAEFCQHQIVGVYYAEPKQ